MKRLYLFFILFLSVTNLFGQIDTEFWFAAPYMSEHCNAPEDMATYHLRIFSDQSTANVIVSIPSDASFTPIKHTIAAGSYSDITIASTYQEAIDKIFVPFDKVSKRGLHIVSDAPIGCYYQITGKNGEAYTLKGKNALGNDFIVAMQSGTKNNIAFPNATSNVQIVATEDNTDITIIPTKPCGSSCTLASIAIHLNKGETYAFKACGQDANMHLIGTTIKSSKPIAVTSNDDSVNSDSDYFGGYDAVGDQLVPNDLLGSEYVAISAKTTCDYCYIIAIDDNTEVNLSNGAHYTLNKGLYQEINLTNEDAVYFYGNKPFSLFQKTGLQGEPGGTNLPQLSCTGSNKASYVKIPYSRKSIMTLLTQSVNVSNFTINNISINSSNFYPVPGTSNAWSYAKIDISDNERYPISSPINVCCATGSFKMGVMDYGDKNNVSGTCTMGYFSDYSTTHEYDEYATISEGQTYTWKGHKTEGGQNMTFTEEGIYKDQLQDAQGCDSTCVLHLNVVSYPDNVQTIGCKLPETGNNFEMVELFRCERAHNVSTPLVVDLDGDGITEIIAPVASKNAKYLADELCIYDGRNGTPLDSFKLVTFSLSGQAIAIADVDKDKQCEIYVLGTDNRIYRYKYQKHMSWTPSCDWSTEVMTERHIPALADVNNDGTPELVCGRYIYNALTGKLLLKFTMEADGMGFGAPCGVLEDSYYYAYYLTALADIDGDNTLELCAGRHIYKMSITNTAGAEGNTCSILCSAEKSISEYAGYNYDGQTMIMDFDGDGVKDVCVMGVSHDIKNVNPYYIDMYVWNSQTKAIIAYTRTPSTSWDSRGTWNTGSIPFAGDIDNNGLPEILFNMYKGGMYAYTYDPSKPGNMRLVYQHKDFAETCGFTVFDFNKDGNNEIVSKTGNSLFIADGQNLNYLCEPKSIVAQTMDEYPVIADVNGDGSAEILIAQTDNYSTHRNGWLSVYGAKEKGTWSSARPIWNQWGYTSVNINQDMTVPQYLFDITTKFPNGKRPFNAFLAQQAIIDQNGNISVPAADVAVTAVASEVKDDSIVVTLSYCNNGDANLLAPYEIAVYQNEYRGSVISVDTIKEGLAINECNTITLKVPAPACYTANDSALIIAINDDGHGIAQHGNQQAECDTTNNVAKIALAGLISRDTTYVKVAISQGETYTFNGQTYSADTVVTANLTTEQGCDSVCVLNLKMIPYPDNIRDDVECEWSEPADDWTIKTKWSSDVSMSPLVIPLVGDINDDGKTEFVCFAANEEFGFFGVDKVNVFSGSSHQIIQSFTIAGKVSAQDAGVYGLVKLSNRHTLLVCYTVDRKMYAYDLSADVSQPLWQTSIPYDAVNISFADFNGDGNPEIYLGSYIYDVANGSLLVYSNSSNSGSALAHNNDGTFKPRVELHAPMAADMDEDGLPELIVGTEIYKINIVNRTGQSGNTMTLYKKITPPVGMNADGHSQVADFNLDGHLDVFISGCRSNGAFFYIWDVFNNSVSQPIFLSKTGDDVGKSIPLIADINVDGIPEVLIQARFNIGNNRFVRAYQYHIASKSFTLLWDLDVDEDSFSNSMTMFDFDHNGTNEIVVTDQTRVRIVNSNGNVLSSFQYGECTVMQYPIIADVDDDGSAEILVIGQENMGHSYKGSVNIFTSASKPWVDARSVWNQYMYNQTNVNSDLTIPTRLYNNAQVFYTTDGKLIRPYNNFLQQATIIDKNGTPFNPAADAAITSSSSEIKNDSVEITLSCCNQGDANLLAPYEITIYQNKYQGTILQVATIKEDLNIDDCKTMTLKVPALSICQVKRDSVLLVAINDDGHGIAQYGNQQAECDTTNNKARIVLSREIPRDTTYVEQTICENELPYTYEPTGITFPVGIIGRVDSVVYLLNKQGCDSLVKIQLVVLPEPHVVARGDTTIHIGDSVLLFASGADYYRWESSASITISLQHQYFAHPTQSCQVMVYGFRSNKSIVFNGDFESGNIGFATAHNYVEPCTVDGGFGNYTVYSETRGLWRQLTETYRAYGGSGNMLIIDGYDRDNSLVWKQMVEVIPNTYYAFSTQIMSCFDSYLPQYSPILQFSANTDQIGGLFYAPTELYKWNKYYGIWYSGNNTSATLAINNLKNNIYGNDFALDEIRFEPLNTECVSVDSMLIFVMKESSETNYRCTGDFPYRWNNHTILDYGQYKDTIISSTGYRDSIVSLEVLEIQPTDSIENATICAGETYTWHDRSYSATTTETETLTNAAGCDSVCTLNLVVYPKLSGDTSATFCKNKSFTWYEHTCTSAGDYLHTFKSLVTGCDSVVTLHLSELLPTDSIENATICEGETYTWHGQTFTTSTTTTETLINSVGCDSVCTLNLTVLPKLFGDTSSTFCKGKSFAWYEHTCTSAGDYLHTFKSLVTGCDSIVTLHLSELLPTDSIENATICEGESYTWHGRTFTTTTTITETLTNVVGCDSVCTLNLVVYPKLSGDTSATFCSGKSLKWYEHTCTAAGDYKHTFKSFVTGCDSIVTLHLSESLPTDSIENATICEGETYIWHGQNFTTTTTTTETLTNAASCDSVCTLNLLVEKCCGPINATIGVPDICADAPTMDVQIDVRSGEVVQYEIHFTNPILNTMPFRDTIIQALSSASYLSIAVPHDKHDITKYPRPDETYQLNMTLRDKCGNTKVLSPQSFSVLYPSWIIEQNWDDVIAVVNQNYNGGYMFSKFEWLQNGEILPGENDYYIYLPHELWTNSDHQYQSYAYQARLTRADDGKAILTCPIEPKNINNTNLLQEPYVDITPTLVPKDHPVVHVMTNTSGTYYVYSATGAILQTADYEPCEHDVFDINLNGTQTMYILVFVPRDSNKPMKDKYGVFKVIME